MCIMCVIACVSYESHLLSCYLSIMCHGKCIMCVLAYLPCEVFSVSPVKLQHCILRSEDFPVVFRVPLFVSCVPSSFWLFKIFLFIPSLFVSRFVYLSVTVYLLLFISSAILTIYQYQFHLFQDRRVY